MHHANIMVHEWKMLESVVPFGLNMKLVEEKFRLSSLVVQPDMVQRIKSMQQTNEEAQKIDRKMAGGLEVHDWTLNSNGNLCYNRMLYVLTG